MVDDIFQLPGGDVQIRDAFNKALDGDGPDIFKAVIKNNPAFKENITRLEVVADWFRYFLSRGWWLIIRRSTQVFDAIAAECATQNIYLHLDNHVSKAGWCCKATDGNSFFGDRHFDVEKWKRALAYMAKHVSLPTRKKTHTNHAIRNPKKKREKKHPQLTYHRAEAGPR